MTTLQTTNVAFATNPGQPVVVPNQVRNSRLNVNAIKGLAITQIVIGILTIILGIASIAGFEYGYWVNASGSGIWFGIWILVTGIIGFYSSKSPSGTGLNGTNMGFNIVCCVVSFLVGIFFLIALIYYSSCERYVDNYGYYPYYYRSYIETDCWDKKDAGVAIYAILTIVMVTEFIVSMVAAIYCCLGGCCGATGATGGVILHQQPTTIVTTSHAGVVHPNQGFVAYPQPFQQTQPGMYPTSTAPGTYPTSTAPGMYPAPQGAYPTMQSYPPQPMGYTHPGGMPSTNITYSSEQQDTSKVAPPPPYVG